MSEKPRPFGELIPLLIVTSPIVLVMLLIFYALPETPEPELYKGPKPANIPDYAVYSGDPGTGHWVACRWRPDDLYLCRIYYSSGELFAEGKFKLKRKSPHGDTAYRAPESYYFNLTYIETELGPMIPVGEYRTYKAESGQVRTLAFYAGHCNRRIGTVRDAEAMLRNFFQRFRGIKNPVFRFDRRPIVSSVKYSPDGEIEPPFLCEGSTRMQTYKYTGRVLDHGIYFRAHLLYCSNCSYQVTVED